MPDAGYEHGIEHLAGEGVALAGNEGGRDGAGVALHGGPDAAVDGIAQAFDRRHEAQRQPRRGRRRLDGDLAGCEAGGADPLEICGALSEINGLSRVPLLRFA
jgi:hypothetical protein